MTIDDPEAAPRRGRPRNEAIDDAAIEAALDLLAEGGVRAVTVHGRTRRQFYKDRADWAAVRGGVAASARW